MNLRIKIGLVVVTVTANIVVFWWRVTRSSQPLPTAPPRSLALTFGEEQAKIISEWKKAAEIPLKNRDVARYVDQLQWAGCVKPPAGVELVAEKDLTGEQKLDLKQSATGLITAYTTGTADSLLKYMAERDQQISPLMIVELKKLLVSDSGFSKVSLTKLDDEEIYLTFAKEAKYAPHWLSLVDGTACAVLWRNANQNPSTAIEKLGGDAASLFKNQTRFHHLFVNSDANSLDSQFDDYEIYADFRFVIKHDQEFLKETSPYYVRFGYNPKLSKWQPLEMVHVATSSGNSPVLLF